MPVAGLPSNFGEGSSNASLLRMCPLSRDLSASEWFLIWLGNLQDLSVDNWLRTIGINRRTRRSNKGNLLISKGQDLRTDSSQPFRPSKTSVSLALSVGCPCRHQFRFYVSFLASWFKDARFRLLGWEQGARCEDSSDSQIRTSLHLIVSNSSSI